MNDTTAFRDVFDANAAFAAQFSDGGLPARAARGLAVITCMDSRLDPFGILGIGPGDAKILRNAGARVTEDVLRTLVLAVYLLGVDRVLVMPHTGCRMVGVSEAEIHRVIGEQFGVDTRSLEFRTANEQTEALRSDLTRIRSFPLLPKGLHVTGAIFDVATGRLQPIDR
ncbi:MAG TPA: carbonic anhydrase [Actinomycetes bacterium]|nr:carbonic anhydrase [Actinomycetes bacterium]